ncbi:MAG TPA: phospholipase D-like domain-containing protein [Candidatus Binataceae bacterium]|nr:phospholipase D-like domain-containing protein [Candidatus Binataceae bacterium]
MADHALSRAAGAPLVGGNQVVLLKDAAENYPAWLRAIKAARHHVYFEPFYIREDEIGREFADALIAKAREGVRVLVIYDWLGDFGKTSRRFWNAMRAAGVEVRCYNPPRFDSPFGLISRDHRKMVAVDGAVGFISGLCVGREWVGDPQRSIAPWRDTGIEVRGPAVACIEEAFAEIWTTMGPPIPEHEPIVPSSAGSGGDVDMLIIATLPATARAIRAGELIAAIARKRLWLTDPYFGGASTYVQALRAAARDGVDVRLLVPNAMDIRLLRPISRSGYRPLLQAGVRIFEWNGTMIHAKTSVADGRWARVGSTNLNLASWFGNCELDAGIENIAFAGKLERMFLEDLNNSIELVLGPNAKVLAPGQPRRIERGLGERSGSAGPAVAGAVRIGNAIEAAFTNRRVLEAVEARLLLVVALIVLALTILLVLFPRLMAYPFAALLAWIGASLLYRAWKLRNQT